MDLLLFSTGPSVGDEACQDGLWLSFLLRPHLLFLPLVEHRASFVHD